MKEYYVCSRRRQTAVQTSGTRRLFGKRNIKQFRRQPTFCMRNFEVGNRRLRCHFALPSPMEIIPTRADGTSIAASHTVLRIGYAGGKRSCRGLLAEQTRVRDRENGFIDHQRKTDSSIPAFLFCIRDACLRAHCLPRKNTLVER